MFAWFQETICDCNDDEVSLHKVKAALEEAKGTNESAATLLKETEDKLKKIVESKSAPDKWSAVEVETSIQDQDLDSDKLG